MHVNFISSRNTRETCIYYVWSDNVNPKNENDDECLPWSIISAFNYREITKKEFENIFTKTKHEGKDFSSDKRDWENFEQNNETIALNVITK